MLPNQQVEKRLRWEKIKPNFVVEYQNLISYDLQAIDTNYIQLLLKVGTCIRKYKEYIQDPTPDEQLMLSNLQTILSQATNLLKDKDDLRLWQEMRSGVNSAVQRIVNISEYKPENLNAILSKLTECVENYTTYARFLTKQELDLKMASHRSLIDLTRRHECLLNRTSEKELRKLIEELHQALVQGNLHKAFHIIRIAKDTAQTISYAEDIENKIFLHTASFTKSIEILSVELKIFDSDATGTAGAAYYLSRKVISEVLQESEITVEADKSLLPRHYNYLVNEIFRALGSEWRKFHLRDPIEFAGLFTNIKRIISNDLITTAWWQRWAPNNWTNAGFCLHQGKKESIASEIRKLIKQYQPGTPAIYVQLPILPLYKEPVFQAASYVI